jgi:hypothetical protein
MKKICSAVIVLIMASNSFACSICGCGGGNSYMGLIPGFKNHFIGVRYHYAEFYTQLANNPTQFSHNFYNTVELWGGYNIGKKFRLIATIPYYFNKQIDDDGLMKKNGIGDVTIIGQYQIFHSYSLLPQEKIVEQQLWLGGGIKMATGSFGINPNDSTTTVADINAQLGTGSTDFIVSGLYNLKVQRFGLNISGNYKINTVNTSGYKYGNKLNVNALAYYRFNSKQTTVVPNAGIGYESVAGNKLNGNKVNFTGSHATLAIAGIEYSFSNIALGFNAQLPIEQNFAEGQTTMHIKAMAHISFAL